MVSTSPGAVQPSASGCPADLAPSEVTILTQHLRSVMTTIHDAQLMLTCDDAYVVVVRRFLIYLMFDANIMFNVVS